MVRLLICAALLLATPGSVLAQTEQCPSYETHAETINDLTEKGSKSRILLEGEKARAFALMLGHDAPVVRIVATTNPVDQVLISMLEGDDKRWCAWAVTTVATLNKMLLDFDKEGA